MCQALIKDTQFGSKIKALSLMLKCEWTNSPEEMNFWKANVDAVTFEIQTNGAFDDDTAEWLSKNTNIIWISCDGTPDIQDAHRICIDKNKKSTELIKKNIDILKKGNCFVGIRFTITDENVDRQIEMIDYFKSIGINTI